MLKIKTIKFERNLRGKRILLRSDLNVPIRGGKILDDYKIKKSLPTIKFLLNNKCRLIIVTHLGRPKNKADLKNLSVKPVANKLEKILRRKINIVENINDLNVGRKISETKEGGVLMLENIRFEKGEMNNDKKLARNLAKLADIYVNDAFAVCHREHSSVCAIRNYLPAYAGLLLENEILNLNKALNPRKPLVVLVGGAKIKTKVPLLKKISKNASHILIGGAIANNFFVAHGLEVGKSLVDEDSIKFAKRFKNKNVILPIDVVVSSNKNGGRAHVKKINKVVKDDYIFDIGPETIKLYYSFIKKAATIVWNGPMGFYELSEFKNGTMSLALSLAARSKGKTFGLVGGGETVDALKSTKMIEFVDWVSTGGGAMLSYLGGEKMPGLKGIVKK